jgi:4-alpha-glucanotransferase
MLSEHERQKVMQQLGVSDLGAVSEVMITDAMISTVLQSRAALAILPLQDVLGLGSEARMNTPGTANGNWTWRFAWEAIPVDLASRLLEQLQKVHRCEQQ